MAIGKIKDLSPPFYLCSLVELEEKYNHFKQAFGSVFNNLDIAYSYKTNYTPAMLYYLHQWGALAEVVSVQEFDLAQKLKLPGNKIIFNGPNKQYSHIKQALDTGVLVNLDSLEEVNHVCEYAKKTNRIIDIGVRVNASQLSDKSNILISRFGIIKEQLKQVQIQLNESGVRIIGIHIHLSSHKRDLAHYSYLSQLLGETAIELGIDNIEYIDIGGGFGYTPPGMEHVKVPSFEQYAEIIYSSLKDVSIELINKHFIVEPGLALVGSVYSYFAPVLSIKKMMNDTTCIFLDGSFHTVKPSGHNVNLPTKVYNSDWKRKLNFNKEYDLVGYTCMEVDYIARNQVLPELNLGDIIEINNVGAYTLVFKPPFIRTRPPIYLLNSMGEIIQAAREEQLDDWLSGYSYIN